MRERRKQGSEKRHQKWGKGGRARREGKRGMKEGEQDGQGGCVGSSVVQESGRKKCNVMRVLPLSEPEREKGT